MTDDKVDAALDRARNVVNGFAKVRDQQARDALALAEHAKQLSHANKLLARQNEGLLKRVEELAREAQHAKDNPFGDILNSVRR